MVQQPDVAIIDSVDDLPYWLERLHGGPLAVDTETTGVKWNVDRVGGLCLAARNTALYACKGALGPAVRWLGDQAKEHRPLVMHHAKFDLHVLRETFGLHIREPVHDTMIMSFLLDNRGAPAISGEEEEDDDTDPGGYAGHSLKELAASFLDPNAKSYENELYDAVIAAGGSKAKKKWKQDVLRAPVPIVGKYGAMDAWDTLGLFHQFEPRVRHWVQPDGDYPSLWSLYETERWLTMALVDMEARGILVDQDFLERWEKKLERRRQKLLARLNRMAGREINWNSPPQMRELLYNDLGISVTDWTKGGKRAGPQPATHEVALLKMDHPIAAQILRYREADKQWSTYAVGYRRAVHTDGRIHPTFKQIGARTGRMSCVNPNMQQATRESGARKGFVPDPDTVFRFGDYSQAEMRFTAHDSSDPVLMNGFNNDPKFDTHRATAIEMWGLTGEPTPRQRKFAKIVNFLMLYGGGENKLTTTLISLLDDIEDAKQAVREMGYKMKPGENPYRTLSQLLLTRYFQKFPTIRSARYRAQNEAEKLGFVMNPFGRHRYLEDWEAYKALNSRIQGAAVDQAKKGLVAMYRELQMAGDIALLLQIHDEAVYLSDGNPKTDRRVVELLNDETSFRIPIIADISGSDKNWHEKKSIELN